MWIQIMFATFIVLVENFFLQKIKSYVQGK